MPAPVTSRTMDPFIRALRRLPKARHQWADWQLRQLKAHSKLRPTIELPLPQDSDPSEGVDAFLNMLHAREVARRYRKLKRRFRMKAQKLSLVGQPDDMVWDLAAELLARSGRDAFKKLLTARRRNPRQAIKLLKLNGRWW